MISNIALILLIALGLVIVFIPGKKIWEFLKSEQ